MSCWVVPSVAAELWGISVEQVLDGMKSGNIPSKDELGRSFVDVAPDSPKMETGRAPAAKPRTFTVITPEELVALTSDHQIDIQPDEHSADLGDWRDARRISQDRRRPPIAA